MPTSVPTSTNDIETSAPVVSESVEQVDSGAFAAMVEEFARNEKPMEVAPWLTKLNLSERRRDVRCLPAGTRRLKRVMDIVLSVTMMIGLAPLMALAWCVVRVSSPGPAIFTQTRVGLNLRRGDRRGGTKPDESDGRSATNDRRQSESYGRPFTIYKFRTMRLDAEATGAQFAQENDPRIIPFGRFMRKSRIDELPQLWNIFRGDMSLVGPRPERPEFIQGLSEEIPNYLNRLGLKPGLTGIAQIENGYDNDIESFRRKVVYDLIYLQNCCIVNDLKIVLRTIKVVFTGKGAL